MSYSCKSCKEKVSNSKMAGLVIGQVSREVLEAKNITRSSFSNGEVMAGLLSGFRVKCPKCGKTNWE